MQYQYKECSSEIITDFTKVLQQHSSIVDTTTVNVLAFITIIVHPMIMSYTLVSLLFVVSFSLPSLGEKINSSNIIQRNNCSHDSECPTWFTCNSSSTCQCGNKQDHAIACDDKLQSSAVLDCYCVTYDNKSRSTYLGLCFYNCGNYKKTDTVYQ